MIDTVKFQIPVNSEVLQKISQRLRTFAIFDIEGHQLEYQSWSKPIQVGSYSHHLNIYIASLTGETLIIELSVPKIFLGDNIHMIDPDKLQNILSLLQLYINKSFDITLPNVELWKLMRLDLCYCWKFESQEKAEEILNVIKNIKVKRRKPNIYKDSVSWVTKNSNYKFYLKYPEYMKHDFNNIFKKDPDRAFSLKLLAEGILRFEVTMRRRELERCKTTRIFQFYGYNEVKQMLINKLKNILPLLTKEYLNDKEAYNKLNKIYSKRKANSLFIFYKNWFSSDESLKDISSKLHRSTIWRKWKDLEYAGLSLPISTSIKLNFDKNKLFLTPPLGGVNIAGSSNTPRMLQDATNYKKEVMM